MARAGSYARCFRTAAAVMLCDVLAHAQGAGDPREVLLHVRQNVVDTIQRLPKYECTLTIDRAGYEPDDRARHAGNGERRVRTCDDIAAEMKTAAWKRRLLTSDRLRLDVAVSHEGAGREHEMYSWAGESGFSDRTLFELVRDGAVSTGSFASLLASIFGGRAARFSYNGDDSVGGRLRSEFGFRIPAEESDYLYIFGNGRGQRKAIAYGGTFLADPETADLVRLVVHASQLPRETGACELTQTLDYGRARLNGSDFLLPSQARLSVVYADETEAENVIHYSACHEFHGESTVRFGPPPEAEVPGSSNDPVQSFTLPPGLPFKLVLTEPIDTGIAAAGDLFRAKLKTAIRDRSSKVLVPEGTPVTGRIVNIRRFYGRHEEADSRRTRQNASLVVALRLESLEIAGTTHSFRAAFDHRVQRSANVTGVLPRQMEIMTLDRATAPGDGQFEFWDAPPKDVVESGLESDWLTIAP